MCLSRGSGGVGDDRIRRGTGRSHQFQISVWALILVLAAPRRQLLCFGLGLGAAAALVLQEEQRGQGGQVAGAEQARVPATSKRNAIMREGSSNAIYVRGRVSAKCEKEREYSMRAQEF